MPTKPKSIPRNRLVSVLGAAQPVWDAILSSLAGQLGTLETEWKPSKSDFGSMCLLKHKGRTLLYLTPQKGSILVALVLGERAVAQVLDSALPETIKALLRDARPYAEGRGIRFPVDSAAHVPLVTDLVALKIAPR